ncbi:MAG: DUF1385 domain-containing protein [Clostridia bacterium]|nr:DUF1385 domain-containing protein [Clostridia bacterium]
MPDSRKTLIGGQALIEGIVMRGKHVAAMGIRLPNGEIEITEKELHPLRDKYKIAGVPVIRGVVNFVESITFGYKCLMESAEKSGLEDTESESKVDKWLTEHFSDKVMPIVGVISAILGVVLALGLFMYLPALINDLLDKYVFSGGIAKHNLQPLVEGIIKIIIFIIYMWAVSQMKDIKRVFMYHGAEHKTIFCYENNEELTVENVRKQIRFHPRCGTSFMFVLMILSIFIATILVLIFPWLRASRIVWVLAKLLVLPVVMGIGYEYIKYAGRHDNVCTKIGSAPGLWMQRISTVEPDDSMIEVGIAAFKYVLEHDEDLDIK